MTIVKAIMVSEMNGISRNETSHIIGTQNTNSSSADKGGALDDDVRGIYETKQGDELTRCNATSLICGCHDHKHFPNGLVWQLRELGLLSLNPPIGHHPTNLVWYGGQLSNNARNKTHDYRAYRPSGSLISANLHYGPTARSDQVTIP